jgi:hypothetical protein
MSLKYAVKCRMELPDCVPPRIANFITERPNGCWSWGKAHSARNLYGVVHWQQRQQNIHRVMYLLLRGDIPEGLVLDHVVCNDKTCANPWHTEPANNSENMLRERKAKTECKHGHSEWAIDGRGYRFCVQCKRSDSARRVRAARGIPFDWPKGKHFNQRGGT